VSAENQTFISRNFTDAETAYCRAQPSFRASFAARWVGKEAVFKSLHREIVQKLSNFSAFLSCNKLKSEKVKK
jgi:phosphopantetheine--protein transferase-like protein